MFVDRETMLVRHPLEKGIHIIAIEVLSLATLLADDQVLVPVRVRQISIAAVRLVHTLDQAEFFQLFQRAIDRYQPQTGAVSFGLFVHIQRIERERGTCYRLDDCLAGVGQAVAVFFELGKPGLYSHILLKIIFNYITYNLPVKKKAAQIRSCAALRWVFTQALRPADSGIAAISPRVQATGHTSSVEAGLPEDITPGLAAISGAANDQDRLVFGQFVQARCQLLEWD